MTPASELDFDHEIRRTDLTLYSGHSMTTYDDEGRETWSGTVEWACDDCAVVRIESASLLTHYRPTERILVRWR